VGELREGERETRREKGREGGRERGEERSVDALMGRSQAPAAEAVQRLTMRAHPPLLSDSAPSLRLRNHSLLLSATCPPHWLQNPAGPAARGASNILLHDVMYNRQPSKPPIVCCFASLLSSCSLAPRLSRCLPAGSHIPELAGSSSIPSRCQKHAAVVRGCDGFQRNFNGGEGKWRMLKDYELRL